MPEGREKKTGDVSGRTIGRLSLYRRLLTDLARDKIKNVFSHQMAELTGGTAAQVRRDMMAIGYNGSPVHGYDVAELIVSIDDFLDAPQGTRMCLVGVGNLGRAILSFFAGRRPKLAVVAAFDSNPEKTGRVIAGCRCYPIEDLARVVAAERITVGVLAVPPEAALGMADRLAAAGIKGIANFSPLPLRAPAEVYVEDIDITMSLEKVAYYARQGTVREEKLS